MIALSGHLIPCGVEFSFLLSAVFCGFFAMFLPFHYCAQVKHTSHCLTVMKDTLYALRSETVISKF